MFGVGEGLTVLGLLLTVAESYQTISKPIKKFKRFHKDLKKYQRQFSNYETIYNGNAESLIRSVVGAEQAEEMFNDSEHPAWSNEELEQSIEERLGKRYASCISTIEAIEEALAALSPISKKIGAMLERHSKETTVGGIKTEVRDIASRISACFSESKIESKLVELREPTEEFERLVLLNERLGSNSSYLMPSLRTLSRDVATKFNRIQVAANALYEDIEGSCTVHNQHNAHFNLLPTIQNGNAQRVQFELAYRQAPKSGTDNSQLAPDPVWLAVESSNETEHCAIGVCQSAATGTSKRKEPESTVIPLLATQVRKRVTFADTETHALLPAMIPSIPPSISQSLANLCKNQNLCAKIMTHFRQTAPMQQAACIGYLEKRSGHKHLIYVKPKRFEADNSMSLRSFLRSFDHATLRQGLPLLEKLRFARLMATAVLHFGTTPWLTKGAWRSNDIQLYLDQGTPSLGNPYISTAIVQHQQVDKVLPKTPRCIRNQLLFSLALILLEIAYEAPLSALRKPSDFEDGPAQAEYNTAERLSNTVCQRTSPEYKRVVRKCLFCLADSADLSDSELQAMVYYDVVCALERLETSCQKCL